MYALVLKVIQISNSGLVPRHLTQPGLGRQSYLQIDNSPCSWRTLRTGEVGYIRWPLSLVSVDTILAEPLT